MYDDLNSEGLPSMRMGNCLCNYFGLLECYSCGHCSFPHSFVSRVSPKDTSHHVILGTHEFRPSDFAQQINLNMDNAWGILRCVIDYFMKCDAGTYLLMKNPNKVSRPVATPLNA